MYMKNIHIFRGIIIIVVAFVLPQGTQAYFTTAQSALKINDTHALFIIEYAFGLKKDDLRMPGVTERGLTWGSKEEKVGYTLRGKDGVITTEGKATAAIISKAPAADGLYTLEKGKAQKMWLAVLFETDKDAKVRDYVLQVDSLPFYVDTGNKDLDVRQLNPSELQYYVTPSVTLNTGH